MVVLWGKYSDTKHKTYHKRSKHTYPTKQNDKGGVGCVAVSIGIILVCIHSHRYIYGMRYGTQYMYGMILYLFYAFDNYYYRNHNAYQTDQSRI